jgi:hypothetical protein
MSIQEISEESMIARNQKQFLTQFAPKILLQVNEKVIHSNSLCTELLFEDGDRRWMKIETFDRDGAITRKAKLLINQRVSITSWDPLNEPLKWTNLGYFRNIYKSV